MFRDIGHLAEVTLFQVVADGLTSLDFAFQDYSQEGPARLLLQISAAWIKHLVWFAGVGEKCQCCIYMVIFAHIMFLFSFAMEK